MQKDGVTSPALRSAVARVYLQGGYVAMAAKHLAAVADDPTADPMQKAMNAALFASAEGDWARAETELRRVLAVDGENFVAVNNLAVALLNQGKLKEVCVHVAKAWSRGMGNAGNTALIRTLLVASASTSVVYCRESMCWRLRFVPPLQRSSPPNHSCSTSVSALFPPAPYSF